MTDESEQAYTVRCTNCGKSRTVTHADGRTAWQTEGTRHTPRSKAMRLQKRAADACPRCGCDSFGVSPKAAEN